MISLKDRIEQLMTSCSSTNEVIDCLSDLRKQCHLIDHVNMSDIREDLDALKFLFTIAKIRYSNNDKMFRYYEILEDICKCTLSTWYGAISPEELAYSILNSKTIINNYHSEVISMRNSKRIIK